MFKLYLGKVIFALQRALSASELEKVREFYDKGYSVNYTIEYLK
jgi:hypothetical protein